MPNRVGYYSAFVVALLTGILVVSSATAQAIMPTEAIDPTNLGMYAIGFIVYQTAAAVGSYYKGKSDTSSQIAQLELRLVQFIEDQLKPLSELKGVVGIVQNGTISVSACSAKHEEMSEKIGSHETRISVIESKLE